MNKIPHDPDEIIAVVNEKDKVIGKATRREAHIKGLLHREAYCYVINSKKGVLLHKRKGSGKWDHSAAGHFPANHSYEKAIVREFEEELGIKLAKSEFKEIAKARIAELKPDKINDRFAVVYVVKKDIPLSRFKIDKTEVTEIKYFNVKELKKLLSKPEKIASSAKEIIEKYIIRFIN